MYSIEKKDGVLEINVNFPPEIIMEYTLHIYEKFKDDYEVEGYKKGEAPLEEIEKAYGERVFFNKAISFAISYVTKNVLEENPEINYTSAPKITFVGDDENLCAYKITMPYIGIKLGRYKGLKIFCGGTLFLSADDPHREMVEQGVIRLSMNDLYEHIIETSEFEFSKV